MIRAGAPYLRLVERPAGFARPPAPCRLDVRISCQAGREPHARSREFKIRETDLAELVAHAARLEARR